LLIPLSVTGVTMLVACGLIAVAAVIGIVWLIRGLRKDDHVRNPH